MSLFDSILAMFGRPKPAPAPAPAAAPAPIPPGATLLALVSESRSVRYSELAAAAPVLEAYAALVKRHWPQAVPLAVRPYLLAVQVPPGAWIARVRDSLPNVPSDYAGYHDAAPTAPYQPRIWVRAGGDWLRSATHELAEALVNPSSHEEIAITFRGRRLLVVKECADPVNGRTFGLLGRQVHDFVFPGWFTGEGPGPYNQRGTIHRPGGLDGGYVYTAAGQVLR